MRLRFYILTLTIVTILALAYTWQQVEIIKLAYMENKKNQTHRDVLDTNRALRYNLLSLKSSSNLGNKLLGEDSGFEMPKKEQIKLLTLPDENSGKIKPSDVFIKNGLIMSLFKIKESSPAALVKSYVMRQAEAQESFRK